MADLHGLQAFIVVRQIAKTFHLLNVLSPPLKTQTNCWVYMVVRLILRAQPGTLCGKL